jgi:hypothetical protein
MSWAEDRVTGSIADMPGARLPKSNEGLENGMGLRAASVVLSIRLPRRTAVEISRFPMDPHLGRF